MEFDIKRLRENPKNPFVFKGNKKEWESFKVKMKRDPEFMTAMKIAYDSSRDNLIIAGNKRVKALIELGMDLVPIDYVIDVKGWSQEKRDRYIVASNWHPKSSVWDYSIIEEEFGIAFGKEWDIEIEGIEEEVVEVAVPEIKGEVQTKLGDLYEIGDHRLLCGDSTDSDQVEKLMNGEKADMVFTDPPYGIAYDNTERWSGVAKQNEKATRSKGSMILNDEKEFNPSFLLSTFSYCKEIFIWGMQYYPDKLGRGGCIVWNRKTESQKDVPHADFELCWSKKERNKMAWITWGGFKSKEKGEDRLHTTQKPIELATWFFENWGIVGDLIVDVFCGSGFSMVAAHQLKRKCYGMELDEKYCDVIVRRMKSLDQTLKILRNGKDISNEDWLSS